MTTRFISIEALRDIIQEHRDGWSGQSAGATTDSARDQHHGALMALDCLLRDKDLQENSPAAKTKEDEHPHGVSPEEYEP